MCQTEAPDRTGCSSTGRHDTATAYRHDGCRCPAARRARADEQAQYDRDANAGRPHAVPASQVREQAQALLDGLDLSAAQLALSVGIHRMSVDRLLRDPNRLYVQRRVAEVIAAAYRQMVTAGQVTAQPAPILGLTPVEAAVNRAALAAALGIPDDYRAAS